jgi:hypothetical protein
MPDAIDDGIAQLVDGGLVRREELRGSTVAELAALEQQLGVRFPTIYRRFLLELGVAAGHFLAGTELDAKGLAARRKAADELLLEDDHEPLAPAAVVFAMHQGNVFLWFDAAAGEDPPVWRYVEAEENVQEFPHFSAWFLAAARDEVEIKHSLDDD